MSTAGRGNARMALASVRGTKWRSLLTMLGVIIGIVSVVMVVGIGDGVKNDITSQIGQFGKDLITVRPGVIKPSNNRLMPTTDLLFGLNSVSGLTPSDLQTVKRSPHVRLAAPMGVVPGAVHSGDGHNVAGSMVFATSEDLPGALSTTVQFGAFFSSDDEGGNYAVLGHNMAQTLFNSDVPLGQTFTFRGQSFIVRGVLGEFQDTPLSPVSDFNNAIFIPYQTAEHLTGNSTQLYSILVKPDHPDDVAGAIKSVNASLLRAHGGEKDFTVLNQQQNIDSSSNVLGLLTTMIAAVAAISLVVGGVGIMNIMLASVTERTHEIGVRKAIGASNRQILGQFVMESIVLSLVGGILGILISLVGIIVLRAYTDLNPVISWQAIIVATGTSLLIGVIFGGIPAIKAASKDPIDALRHE